MFTKLEKNGVLFFVSDKIKYPHAFSTRIGGISENVNTKSLNLAYEKGDDDCIVNDNYRIFLSAASLCESRAYLKQIHSIDVFYAEKGGYLGQGDGLYTDKDGVTLIVKVADCIPVILCDEKAGVIGAAHSGWRGCIHGIVGECIDRMVSLGAKREDIFAAAGPSIQKCCFEVKDDFIAEVRKYVSNADDYITEKDSRYYCDLQKILKDSLSSFGIPDENIDIADICTACNNDIFYSHRVQGSERGTMCAAICKNASANS